MEKSIQTGLNGRVANATRPPNTLMSSRIATSIGIKSSLMGSKISEKNSGAVLTCFSLSVRPNVSAAHQQCACAPQD